MLVDPLKHATECATRFSVSSDVLLFIIQTRIINAGRACDEHL